jgi:hypothetical protein
MKDEGARQNRGEDPKAFPALTRCNALGRTQRSLVGHPTRTNRHTFGGARTIRRREWCRQPIRVQENRQ